MDHRCRGNRNVCIRSIKSFVDSIWLTSILNSFIWFVFGNYTECRGEGGNGGFEPFLCRGPYRRDFYGGFLSDFHVCYAGDCIGNLSWAKPENRSKVGGMLLSVGATAFLTGITEPIEFMFMFFGSGIICTSCCAYRGCNGNSL